MASNNSDRARYSNRNISPVSLKMAVLMSSSQMKARLRYSSHSKSNLPRKDWKNIEKIQFTVKVTNLYTSYCQPKLKILEDQTLHLWGSFLQICAQIEII